MTIEDCQVGQVGQVGLVGNTLVTVDLRRRLPHPTPYPTYLTHQTCLT